MRASGSRPAGVARVGLAALVLVSLLAGCNDVAPRGESATGAAAPDMAAGRSGHSDGAALGATLAYEHSLSVSLPADAIPGRIAEVQSACTEGRFGACVVLHVRQQGGDHPSGSVGMRIVPAGVEPMVALAGEDAAPGTRSTHAEDLAVVLRDNAMTQERLRRELERLREFQARRDLAVADMIALSERLAATEAQLEAVAREEAQHRNRIDTQRLTVDFSATRGHEAQGEVARALRDFGAILATGTAWTIRATAFLLPVLVVVLVLLAFLRRRRRRRKAP